MPPSSDAESHVATACNSITKFAERAAFSFAGHEFNSNYPVTDPGDGGPAPLAYLGDVYGVAVDALGNLFIADSRNNIRKVNASGIISRFAGGLSGYSGDGGPAIQAGLRGPTAVAVDTAGNILIADVGNNVIRKVTPDGIIGTAVSGLNSPSGVSADNLGTVFIADTMNNRILQVTPTGHATLQEKFPSG